MKNLIKLIIAISLINVSLSSHAIPPEFRNCDKETFSFGDLKYYEKQELVDGFCACKSTSSFNLKKFTILQKLQILTLQIDGPNSYEYLEGEKKGTVLMAQSAAADSNASRILRILKKDYKYSEAPRCDDK